MENKKQKTGIEKAYSKKLIKVSSDSNIQAQVLSIGARKWDKQVGRAPKNSQFIFKIKRKNMFQIFEIRGKRFEYSNIIRSPKFSNPNPNIRDSRKKIRIRIESEYIRSPLILFLKQSSDRYKQIELYRIQPNKISFYFKFF